MCGLDVREQLGRSLNRAVAILEPYRRRRNGRELRGTVQELGLRARRLDNAALFDVAINDEATAIERLSGRHLMSGFHGMFSLGGMVGAAAWSALAPAGVTPTQHLLGATAVLGALALAATPFMLRQHRSAPAGGAGLSLPRGPLLLLGVMAGLGLVGEGAMYDWSVLYLRQELGAPTSIASMSPAELRMLSPM